MSGATTTTLAPLIEEQITEGMSVHWRNMMVLALFGPGTDQKNDTGVRTRFHYNGQTAVEWSEGDAPPAAGYQSYVEGLQSFRNFRVPIEVSGHAQDERQDATGDGYMSALAEEQERALNDLMHGINTGLLDTSTGGLQGLVDDSTAFMGLARATYTQLAAYESAVGGALTLAALKTMTRTLRDQPRAGRPNLIIFSPTIADTYTGIVDSGANFHRRDVTAAPGDAFDIAPAPTAARFQGIATYEMPDLTASVLLCIQREDFYIKWKRRVKVRAMGATRDADMWDATARLMLGCRNPRRQGKLTGLT